MPLTYWWIILACIAFVSLCVQIALKQAESRDKKEAELRRQEQRRRIDDLDRARIAFMELTHSDTDYSALGRYWQEPELIAIVNHMISVLPGMADIRLTEGVDGKNGVAVMNLLLAIYGIVPDDDGATANPKMWPLLVTKPPHAGRRYGSNEILLLSKEQELALVQLWQDTLRGCGLDVRLGWNEIQPAVSERNENPLSDNSQIAVFSPHIRCQWIGCEFGTAALVPTEIEIPPEQPTEEIMRLRAELKTALEQCRSKNYLTGYKISSSPYLGLGWGAEIHSRHNPANGYFRAYEEERNDSQVM